MFNSVVSYIFGTNTPTPAPALTSPPIRVTEIERVYVRPTIRSITTDFMQRRRDDRIVSEHTIVITPTLATGAINKQNKSRRNRNKNKKNNRQGSGPVEIPRTSTPTITKLLTPNESFEQDFDEDDWLIVDKEEEDKSLPRTDSEEELYFVEACSKPAAPSPIPKPEQQPQRRRQPYNSRFFQTQRKSAAAARTAAAESASNLRFSPHRSIAGAVGGATNAGANANAPAAVDAAVGGNVTQSESLYANGPSYRDVAVAGASSAHNTSNSSNGSSIGVNCSADESWYVTPPPCFTSAGPENMETSPYENLLIEHPSMSVYHSIRSAQEATDSLVNLDLGVDESQRCAANEADIEAAKADHEVVQADASSHADNMRDSQIMQAPRAARSARLDRASAAQLKQELLERETQKCYEKKQRSSLCRGAIKRANKVRDVQAGGKPKRRSDMQHCKIYSRANNNRKSHY